jgi:ubiquinone biosynthesis accessory factor UbiK
MYPSCTLTAMPETKLFDEFKARLGEALRSSPAQDLEKNLNAMLTAFFDRFDLAAREDLEVHRKLLERAQAKLAALEARVAELESRKP